MPRRRVAMNEQEARPTRCERIRPSDVPDHDLVRHFIMENPRAEWGPLMEQALREGLTCAGFTVTRCQCLETHPVVAIRLRGPAEMTDREARQRIRKLAKDLGHRAPADGMAITGRAGRFDGAFVMEPLFGAWQPSTDPMS